MPRQGKLKNVRVRIAPSPTGPLHIGTARSALFNYLFAKRYKGKFILRLEDTDLERSDLQWEKDIRENLKWLGLNYDEGPDKKGEYGPYRQSERIKTYRKYLEQLLAQGDVYYCYCPEKELADERLLARTKGEPPRYSGKCRNLTPVQIKKFKKEGRKPVIRFKVPGRRVKFQDLIRGELEFDCSLLGDFIIAKGVNIPLYNFAVVIDDYLMKISHIIRGEDHIANTPKQILMQEALGFPRPKYAHLPLILNPDRSKMSKRKIQDGGVVIPVTIQEFKEEGYLPQALVNYMAFLGWNPKDNREIFSLSELACEFSLSKVNRSGAVFNINKLNNINGYYIRKMETGELTRLIIKDNFLKYDLKKYSWEYIKKAIKTVQERLKKMKEVQDLTRFYFQKPDYNPMLLIWKKMSRVEVKKNLEIGERILSKLEAKYYTIDNLEKILKEGISEYKLKTGGLLWPLRVALTGEKGSPSPFEVASVLGKKEVLERIKIAIDKISR